MANNQIWWIQKNRTFGANSLDTLPPNDLYQLFEDIVQEMNVRKEAQTNAITRTED